MEGLGGNGCRGKDSMTLRGIYGHSGAAAELGQEAMAKADQEAPAVFKWHSADLLAMWWCGLKAKTKCHRLGGEGGLVPAGLPRSPLV
jgi:hypothetical protein